MRLDLTAAEHTNCPWRARRLLIALAVLLLAAPSAAAGRYLNWRLPGRATVTFIWR
jgi:hypothetical protein